MTRVAGRGGWAALATALAVPLLTGALWSGASGVERPRVTVSVGSPKQMGPEPDGRLDRSVPWTVVRAASPEECSLGVSLHCDTVPLSVVAPDIAPGDDWYLLVTLSWRDHSVLDLFLWDDGQIKSRDYYDPRLPGDNGWTPEEQTTEHTRLGSLTGPQRPSDACVQRPTRHSPSERCKSLLLWNPDLEDYNLTILDFNGSNTSGYWIEAEVVVVAYDPPDEITEP